MDKSQLAQMIDHTLLKPEATQRDIQLLCEQAREFGFFSVCVNPCWVSLSRSILESQKVRVCGVAGFPLGANKSSIKAKEAEQIVSDGGTEVDMVLNIGRLHQKDFRYVEDDITAVRKAIGKETTLKVIIEAAILNDELKRDAARIVCEAGAQFIKTSTGFSAAGGATVADVALLHSLVAPRAKVKAAGGIRNLQTALEMAHAGASRLGCSAGVAIIKELMRESVGAHQEGASAY